MLCWPGPMFCVPPCRPPMATPKSLFLQAQADALARTGQVEAAQALRVQCFVQEPVSLQTPASLPTGVTLDTTQWLERAQRLLEANRNDRALAALAALDGQKLPPSQACTAAFTRGLAQRKQRRYIAAEEALTQATQICTDIDLVRRAGYLRIKVISIRDGLRAIGPIEAFAKAYPTHSMTDDVLFWAGDMYQRRNRFAEAKAYYERVDALAVRDDYCAEARFRLGWMRLKENDYAAAVPAFERLLLNDGCVTDPHDQSRARYWLGWVYEQNRHVGQGASRLSSHLGCAAAEFLRPAGFAAFVDAPAGGGARGHQPCIDGAHGQVADGALPGGVGLAARLCSSPGLAGRGPRTRRGAYFAALVAVGGPSGGQCASDLPGRAAQGGATGPSERA